MNFQIRNVFKKSLKVYSQCIFWIIFLALFTTFLLGRRTESRLSHDFSSYVLPAFAQSHGQGNVYVDYFINRPPILFSLIEMWGNTFGWRYSSWVLLEISCLLVVSLCVYSLARQFLYLITAQVLTLIFLLTLLFSDMTSMFLTSEILALSFIILATFILVKAVDLKARSVIVSSALITISTLVREQFALIPVLFIFGLTYLAPPNRSKLIVIMQALIGAGIILIFVSTFFVVNQSFSSFYQIFANTFREERVGFLQYGTWSLEALTKLDSYFYFSSFSQFGFLVLLFPVGLVCLHQLKQLREKRGSILFVSNTGYLVFIWIIGISLLISTGWQSHGYRYHGHYALPSFLGLTIACIGVLGFLQEISNRINSRTALKQSLNILLIVIIFVLYLPGQPTMTTFSESYIHIPSSNFIERISKSDSEVLSSEEVIAKRILLSSPKNFNCSVNVYGWGVADFYYYTQSKPCSRFFLVNLLRDDKDFEEYRDSLVSNPPRVISYGCVKVECSDLNYVEIEQLGFPFSKVIKSCYHMIQSRHTGLADEGLYLSNSNSPESQKLCINIAMK